MKQSLKEFLEKVISPIEDQKVDNGKVFISLKALWTPFKESIDIQRIDGIQKSYWKIEDGKLPGGWVTHDKSGYHTYGIGSRNIGLYTLSLLLFTNALQETLFEAEYEGPHSPLKCDQEFSYGLTFELINKKMPKYFEQAFNCLPAGVNAEKARLQKRVLKWNYFTGWQFGLTCIKRTLAEAEKDARLGDYKLPGFYYEALSLGEALMKYMCTGKDESYKTLQDKYKEGDEELGFRKQFSSEDFVMGEINNWVKERYDLMQNFLASGLSKCFGKGGRPWEAAGDARAQIALFKIRQFDKQFTIPSLIEDNEAAERIFYAFMKEEMDWQVQYLIDLLDE